MFFNYSLAVNCLHFVGQQKGDAVGRLFAILTALCSSVDLCLLNGTFVACSSSFYVKRAVYRI